MTSVCGDMVAGVSRTLIEMPNGRWNCWMDPESPYFESGWSLKHWSRSVACPG